MRFLKQRPSVHSVPSEPRSYRQTVFRWLYLAGVLAFAIWLVDFSFSGLLRFQSSGLVVGEPAVVAAEFTVTVQDLPLKQGDTVKKGQIAAVVSSQNVAETIARLTAEIAARQARLSELRMNSAVIDRLLPLAENRQKVATAARQELESLLASGYVALNQRTTAIEFEYQSHHDLETLKAQRGVIVAELDTLNTALSEASGALDELRKLFDGGRLRAPIDGVVSQIAANKGSVVRAGDSIVDLYGTQRFILAYLPTGGLYHVEIGDEVNIKVGFRSTRGTITRIEPVAARLPREFQLAFRPVETQQVIRVDFSPDEVPPPLFTKVSLTSSYFLCRWFDICRKHGISSATLFK
jgi:multidrug resistance efflux pump